jgi:alkanesulfonate monooxygenase SsuD/methylene tetrahydromethanopterin reductase-like flavin-dependent oxidoreductase (luciferase family)
MSATPPATRSPVPPLAPGSISLRLYPHELAPDALLAEMCAQARLAEAVGFDGVMTSEHHGGFRGYLPNPLQVAGFLLADMERAWAAPCPLLLPLRHWTQVVEDVAWLAARYPGRVGAGFAAGGLDRDFELAEIPYSQRMARFKQTLPQVTAALQGDSPGPLAGDAAVAACAAQPVPCVSAALSPPAARRAARLGLGVLYDSLQTAERVREVSQVHRASLPEHARGPAPRILIRRVWLGPAPSSNVESQMGFYRGYADPGAQVHWGEGQELVAAASGDELAERLAQRVRAADCDALNLRLHLHGLEPGAIREQLERIGRQVLPGLRQALAA